MMGWVAFFNNVLLLRIICVYVVCKKYIDKQCIFTHFTLNVKLLKLKIIPFCGSGFSNNCFFLLGGMMAWYGSKVEIIWWQWQLVDGVLLLLLLCLYLICLHYLFTCIHFNVVTKSQSIFFWWSGNKKRCPLRI